ncbi:hypothetical protein [Parahaliea mediterranea]|uniref:hypothetical protein n=1 Tax=Parahaliea mediterranea TaxID=651086 RepID=UPI00130080ED|nr:hypothetical protein [Parahaliea mediterranea]
MRTMTVSLDHARLLLGLRGQQLGLVRQAIVDTDTGTVEQLLLETRWQQVGIPWQRVAFDAESDSFQLQPARRRNQPS